MRPREESELDPADVDDLPMVELARGENTPPRRPVRTWWFVIAAAVVVVVGLTVGIVVFDAAAPDRDVGSATAAGAAREYVRAVDAGDKNAAAAISCPSYENSARAAARSGTEGFRFTLERVRARGGDTALATVRVTLHVSGASQSEDVHLNVFRDQGRWSMCGQAD